MVRRAGDRFTRRHLRPWFRIDGPVTELYDLAVVPGVMRPMSLGFTSSEILELITHDPLPEGALPIA